MPPSADYNQGIAGITFVVESLGTVLAVAAMTDLHVLVQEDEYITDSETHLKSTKQCYAVAGTLPETSEVSN